jgi:hypothetical protein
MKEKRMKLKQRELAPESCNDHYLFWRTYRAGVQQPVRVQGQFDGDAWETLLLHVEYLGNPATKQRDGREVEPVHHPQIHLLAYELSERRPAPPSGVQVRNQFTRDDWTDWQLGVSRYLLIPARKAKGGEPDPDGPPPPRVDHFLCYEVLEGPAVEESVWVVDQFGESRIEYLRPILLGVPCDKNGEGVLHPDVHLAIYEIAPGVKPPTTIGVRTADQLRRLELSAIESVWLGVPSLKRWNRG